MAIERSNLGWILEPNAAATLFWREYWELANAEAPVLQMPMPGLKPATTAFVRFYPATLPGNVWLRHGLPYGNVHLMFSGQDELTLGREVGHRLSMPRMRIERAGRSAAIRIKVPVVDQFRPLSLLEPAVREALDSALELLHWYNRNMAGVTQQS